jgi:hypothetical protein
MVVAAVSCRYDRAPLGSGRLLASVLLCFVAVTLSLGPGEPTSLAVQEVEKRFDVQCLVDLDTGKPAVPGQVMGDHGLLLVLLHPDCPACERSLLMLPVLEERLAESGIRVVAAWAAAVEDVIGIPEYYCPAKCLPDVVVGRFPLLVMIDPTGEMSLAVFTELTPSTIVQLEEVIQSRIPKAIDSRK